MPQSTYDCFAITAPGIESITAGELVALGVTPTHVERGGVSWSGSLETVYRANLELRTASRVLVRVARFSARTFAELERHAKRVAWGPYLTPNRPVRFRVTCKKSRLYHSGAVVERLAKAVAPLVGDESLVSAARGVDEQDVPDAQLFVVRIDHDEVTVSADTSGALLHRRGYRLATAKAPLRETLAAAMVLASGWDGHSPFIDPMCGSGTVPIEAALFARRIAPGLSRSFSFLHWPHPNVSLWATMVSSARERALPRCPGVIRASDRDAGAVRAAVENAERAEVEADVDVTHAAISAVAPAGSKGWIVSNPPYGIRVGDATVRNLYAQFGKVLHANFVGWNVGLLSAYDPLLRQTRINFERTFGTSNGGIPVRFMMGTVEGRK